MFYFLYGDDNFRSLAKLNQLKKDFAARTESQNIFTLEAENFNLAQFKNHLQARGLFSQEKLIVIKNLLQSGDKKNQEKILEILKNNRPEQIFLIFYESNSPDKRTKLYKKLVQLSKRQKRLHDPEYKPLTAWQINQWTADYLKNSNLKIDPPALNYLTASCGPDLWRLKNELDKIRLIKIKKTSPANQTAPRAVVNLDLIKELISGKIDDNIFHLTDALANKNKPLALKLIDQQISSGLDPFYLFAMIVRQFRILIKIKQAIDKYGPDNLASKIEEHPFVVSKGLAQSKLFSLAELAGIYRQLQKIDLQLKSTSLDPKVLLQKFIFKF